jgi:putative endopeptidase
MRLTLILSLVLTTFAATGQERGVFLEDIDRNVDACTNFFDYANGAWRAKNPIPASMTRWSRRWASGELSKEQLKTILDETSARRDWPKGSVDQQIGDFYGSCMDEQRINALGHKPIQPLLAEIDRVRSRAALQETIAKFHDLTLFVPFSVTATPDRHDPNRVIARVGAGGLGLPDRDYYLKPEPRFAEARDKYRAHIARMFELTGTSSAAAKQAADSVLEMETRLARLHLDRVARRDPHATDNLHLVSTLQKMTPSFDWDHYLDRAGISVPEINVDQPLFVQAVEQELKTTPLSTWRTYLKWHLLRSAATHLSDDFAKENFAFYEQYLGGAKEMKPRWKRCVETADQLLGEALGQRYVERYFPAEAKARMQEMVKNILTAMGETIQGLEWMSPQTRQQAMRKLSTFNPKVGYPDKWKDYSSIPVSRDAYVQNVLAGLRYDTREDRAQIGKPVDRGLWGMTPPTSNAYYYAALNEIVFPAGILQPPAFDVNATDAVNYGAIGVIIGHEISHGFDDQGSKFDADGRLKNWWTESDLKQFRERAACVSDQFENYFVEPGLHHRGGLVLGESIGDLAGAKIAYRALQIAQRTKPGRTIDGFTPDQQFFIAWGQFRGDEIRLEQQRLMVQNDPHPTGKYRVIGPLSNMPEFATAFGCKAGAEMVRPAEKRCEVW